MSLVNNGFVGETRFEASSGTLYLTHSVVVVSSIVVVATDVVVAAKIKHIIVDIQV